MSSAMTEVAVRLAEPDRAAEQSAASLGQAVRRQVSFMNEAISRALGRAGELEALVHNEVAALEKSYSENEHKIKGLIQELVGERHALVSTTDKVSETLKPMGSEVPSADREPVAAADQARQDHRRGGAEPDRAREQARHRQRQPRNQRSPTAPSSCRPCSTTTRWRSMPRWPTAPRRSTCSWWSARARSMPPSRSAWRWSTTPCSARPGHRPPSARRRRAHRSVESHVQSFRHAGAAGADIDNSLRSTWPSTPWSTRRRARYRRHGEPRAGAVGHARGARSAISTTR